MKRDKRAEIVVPIVMGALSAAYIQSWTGWWLNSGTGVAVTMGMLFLLAVFFGPSRTGWPWTRAIALWVGSMTGLAASLFWMGPGTIWPIVLVASSILTACAVIAGSALNRLCGSIVAFASARKVN